jgi:peptidoglycan/LPS O-acetylase OafA/YrhL
VLTAVLLASWFIGPDSRRRLTALDVSMSALDVQNWWQAFRSVNYLSSFAPPSPVQHFWSLSVEEQFYAFWPVLLVGCGWLAARRRLSLRLVARWCVGALVALSLAYCVWRSPTDPAGSYFVTQTRIWELGVGAILATFVSSAGSAIPGQTSFSTGPVRACAGLRPALAPVGLAMIAIAVCGYSASTTWPGYAAVLPVLGAAAVVAAATDPSTRLGRVLTPRPLVVVGDLSYALYLWHWPIIVFLPAATGHDLTTTDRFSIVVVSLLLAAASKVWVEDPFRKPGLRPGLVRPFAVALTAIVALVGVAGLDYKSSTRASNRALAQARALLASGRPCLGAAGSPAAGDRACASANTAGFVPATIGAISDRPAPWSDGCLDEAPNGKPISCVYGDPTGNVSIALVGNSHAAQWLPALDTLGKRDHWKITTFVAGGCAETDALWNMPTPQAQRDCHRWGRSVLTATTTGKFDLVVTSALSTPKALRLGKPAGFGLSEYADLLAGYRQYLSSWAASGTKVLVLRDTPMPLPTVQNVPDCLATHRTDTAACGGSSTDWTRPDPLTDAANSLHSNLVTVADLLPFFCTATCPPVIGGVVVYFDGLHVAATYAQTLAPYLEPYLNSRLTPATVTKHPEG